MAVSNVCQSTGCSTFSPVTLFECTVSNASMLVESMEECDLVIALRVTNQLQSKIIDVLDPKLSSLVDRANNAQFPSTIVTTPEINNAVRLNSNNDFEEPLLKRAKFEDSSENKVSNVMKHDEFETSYDNFHVKVKDEDYCESDDDVILLEPDDGFGQAALAVASANPSSSVFYDSTVLSGSSSNSLGQGFACGNRSIRCNPSGEIDIRSYMRQAYKNLKGSGPHLFDFSQPFSSSKNQTIAQRVVEEAQHMVGGNPWGNDVWRNVIFLYHSHKVNHSSVKRCHRRKNGKLSRRQRSFESIFHTLDPETADRFRVVLARDFTSSDEEVDEEGDVGVDAGGGGGSEGNLRVRLLPWESEIVRDMKARLDEVYLNQFASEKQRIQISRTQRDSRVRSLRPRPGGAPLWAVQ